MKDVMKNTNKSGYLILFTTMVLSFIFAYGMFVFISSNIENKETKIEVQELKTSNINTLTPCDCEQFNGQDIPKEVLIDCYLEKIYEARNREK